MSTTEISRSRRKGKCFYVVVKGLGITEPTLFRSWATAHTRVDGIPRSSYRGFYSEAEAREYICSLNNHTGAGDVKNTETEQKGEETSNAAKDKWFYAVSNGRKTGVFKTWDEASIQVAGFSGSCHKRFMTEEEAEQFVNDGLVERLKRSFLHSIRVTRSKEGYQMDNKQEEMLYKAMNDIKL